MVAAGSDVGGDGGACGGGWVVGLDVAVLNL